MGVDHTVYLVFGLKLEHSQLREEYEYPSCKHPQPDITKEVAGVALSAKPKFCAECGKENRTFKSSRWKKQFEDLSDEDEIAGFELLHGSNYTAESPYYIGNMMSFDQYRNDLKLEVPDLTELKKVTQAALKPLGLWDESKFGTWLVNRWS